MGATLLTILRMIERFYENQACYILNEFLLKVFETTYNIPRGVVIEAIKKYVTLKIALEQPFIALILPDNPPKEITDLTLTALRNTLKVFRDLHDYYVAKRLKNCLAVLHGWYNLQALKNNVFPYQRYCLLKRIEKLGKCKEISIKGVGDVDAYTFLPDFHIFVTKEPFSLVLASTEVGDPYSAFSTSDYIETEKRLKQLIGKYGSYLVVKEKPEKVVETIKRKNFCNTFLRGIYLTLETSSEKLIIPVSPYPSDSKYAFATYYIFGEPMVNPVGFISPKLLKMFKNVRYYLILSLETEKADFFSAIGAEIYKDTYGEVFLKYLLDFLRLLE